MRDTFASEAVGRYREPYQRYDGDAVVSDNALFLENYRRIVNQIGRSFPNAGIEILLHNLVNPSRSLVAIENADVTGRAVGTGATNLVLDLKTRRQRGEDKVNYELNIGSRQFKCTTIPIFRPDYGLVGAICINIDTRFLRDDVMHNVDHLEAFFDNLLRTDFQLDENILSKDEYRNGKRHFLDEAIRTGGGGKERQLAAILFSDIVGFTAIMGEDEATGARYPGRQRQDPSPGVRNPPWEAAQGARRRHAGEFRLRIGRGCHRPRNTTGGGERRPVPGQGRDPSG